MQELIEIVRENTRMRIALELLKEDIDKDEHLYMAGERVTKMAFEIAGIPLKEKDPTTSKQ